MILMADAAMADRSKKFKSSAIKQILVLHFRFCVLHRRTQDEAENRQDRPTEWGSASQNVPYNAPPPPLTTYIKTAYDRLVGKVRTNIYLTDDQMKRLEILRGFSGSTMAEQVRRAIDFWLDSQEQKLIARYRPTQQTK